MCGIAGIAGDPAGDAAGAVRRMMAALAHRGPDGAGLYESPGGACVLGHRRLAILDRTEAAHQPMVSPDGRFVLAYNGELYNFRDLASEAESIGGPLRSTGDTEILLRLLGRHGAGVLPRLNGMYALALWDEHERTLLLARDRFGQKPLYYARAGRRVVFASELRALWASGLVDRRVDVEAVQGYLSLGAVAGPRSIAKGVQLLPAAAHRIFGGADGRWTAGCHSPPDAVGASPRSGDEEAGRGLRDTFAAAVRRHLVSDAPIGLFLSGGVDSSSIAAAAVRATGAAVKSLCVVHPDHPEQSESLHARRMADHAGTEHVEVPVDETALRGLLDGALEAMDQPTSDGINTHVVAHAARQAGLKVALSGLGGDELFGGYPSFRDVPRLTAARRLAGPMGAALSRALSPRDVFDRHRAKIADALGAGATLDQAYRVRRQMFSPAQIEALMPGGLGADTLSFWRGGGCGHGRDPLDQIGLLEMNVYMGQQLLRDSDAMGMAVGLEIRMPFLDEPFATRAMGLPPLARRPGAVNKAYWVGTMGDWLPSEVTRRPKQGFTMPFSEWMTGPLRDRVDHGLQTLAMAGGMFDAGMIRNLWAGFLKTPARIGWSRPWSLFVLGDYMARWKLTA